MSALEPRRYRFAPAQVRRGIWRGFKQFLAPQRPTDWHPPMPPAPFEAVEERRAARRSVRNRGHGRPRGRR